MSERNPNSNPMTVLKAAIVRAFQIIEQHKEDEATFKEEKEKVAKEIGKGMREFNKEELEFIPNTKGLVNDGFVLSCKHIKSNSIIYLQDKIEEKFDKEFCNEVIDKQYSVNDMAGLISLMKEYGVNPKEFKKFIIVQKTVNESRLNQLYELGEITMEDLDGCYELSNQKDYWKVSAKKS